MSLSNYAINLKVENNEEFIRYINKIKIINSYDPYFYINDSKWCNIKTHSSQLPSVVYLDIYNYFVCKKSAYTFEQFKCHKSLNAYDFFTSGHVRSVKWIMKNEIYIVIGQVAHSFSLGAENLSAWVLIKKDGEIITGHCTCVAGKGESCSHVAAICFWIEFYSKKRAEGSSTVDLAYWIQPGQSTKYVLSPKAIGEVSFINAKRTRLNFESEKPLPVATKTLKCVYDTCHSAELVPFLNKYKEACSTPLLRVIKPFCDDLKKSQEMPPMTYGRLYEEESELLTLEELLLKGEEINLTLTSQQRDRIEAKTRRQSESKLWFMYRTGRITASNVRAVCHVKSYASNLSLLKKICYPGKNNFRVEAMEWGCKHEGDAINTFKGYFSNHSEVEIRPCGLYIHAEYPFLAATPDSIISCSCCGTGILEVKCPFCLRTKSMEEIQWLDNDNGSLSLKKDHSYYYQVQSQLFCVKASFAEFVVWSPNNKHHFERILPDQNLFLNIIVPKCTAYFKNAVLPQLLGRYWTNMGEIEQTKKENENDKENDLNQENLPICICRPNIKAKRTIICTRDGCDIVKYHYKCIGLTRFQKNWVCDACKMLNEP